MPAHLSTRVAACAVLLAVAGCMTSRRPLRPIPGSDLAQADRSFDRLVRETLQRCDSTGRPVATTGSSRDPDPCRRIGPDTLARTGKVP
jgi:hypothetical protein